MPWPAAVVVAWGFDAVAGSSGYCVSFVAADVVAVFVFEV